MADQGNPLGDLTIGITGDFSDLESQLEGAQEAAATAGQAIADAFTTAATTGTDQLEQFASAANDAIGSVSTEAIDGVGQSLDDVAGSTGPAAQGLSDVGSAAHEASAGAEDAEGGLEGLAEQLVAVGEALAITEGLQELGSEALSAADGITRASIALTAITGSGEQAQETIEGLEQIGQSDGLAMPSLLSAATRMQQLLGPGADVVDVLQSVADGAAVMGTSIDQAANMFDRMAASGTANARSLTSLGLSTTTLAAAIDEVTGSTDTLSANASTAFKALDQSTRIQVLQEALSGLAGTAEQVANQTFGGQWTALANAWEAVMVQVGQAILPVIASLVQLTKTDIVPFIQSAVEAFRSLPGPIQDVVVSAALLGPILIAGTAALGALAIGINGLTELVPNIVSLFGSLAVAEETAGLSRQRPAPQHMAH